MKSFNFIINQFIRCVSGASLNLFRYTAKSCDSQGVVTATSYGASDEHPMSTRSASDGSTRQTRVWKYAAMLLCVLTLGIGNAWAGGGSTNYYANLTISKTGETGKGKVYYATSNSKPSSETSDALKSAGSTTQNANQTYYWWVDVDPGYNVTVSGKITAGPATAATLSGNVACAQSSSSGSGTSYTATANIVAVTVNSVDAASKDLAPTNPSIDYPFTVTFATSNLKTIALDLDKSPESADGKFSITSWALDEANVVASGKFNGGGSYGGANRNHSTTVSLQSKASGSAAKTCTVTANFPAMAFVSVEADDVFATQGESGKTGSATFKYNYAAEDDFPTTPTLTPTSGTGALAITGYTVTPNFSDGTCEVTVDYTYDTNNGVGDTEAILTLTAANGDARSVTIAGHSEAMATDDATVIAADGETEIYTGDWATAWTKANTAANAGCTLYLLRNVGGLTAYQEVKNTFTLDLNGKILSGKRSGTLIYLNTTGKTLTIKDSKTGGKIQHINNEYAGTPVCVNVTKGSLILESGTLYCENQGASGRKAGGVICKAGTTFTMNGGKIDVWGYNGAYGVSQESDKNDNTIFNMNNGEITVLGYSDIYGISAAGKVNVKDGATINATATYSNCRGITLSAVASATAANCYYGQLTMTGGTINSTCTANADGTRYAYGIVLEGSYTASMGTGVATDGSHANKAAAIGTIENATINVSTLGRYAYGVLANGSYQSKTNHYDVIQIKNTKIDVTSQYYYTYGVYANCGINSTNGGIYAANIELTNCDVTATTTKNHTAYAVWAVATATTIYKNAQPNYYGEYAGGATITVNSGTYTANTGTTNAYAIGTSARAKTTYDSESNMTAERKLGGNAEEYATLNIHGGTFRANTGSTTARAVSNGGNCTIDGGEFYATAGSSTADGIYTVSGKLKASGVKIEASATGTVYGVRVDAANVPYNTDAAWTGFNYAGDAELNNLDVTVTARTGDKAYGVYLNAVSYQYTQSAFDTYMQGRIDAGKVTQANADIWAAVFPGNSSYAIAGKAVINGGKYTVRAATTTAHGIYSVNRAVSNDKAATAATEMTVKNVKLDVKTNGTTTACGIRTAGPSTIDGADIKVNSQTTTCYGMIISDQEETTVTNTKIDASGTATVYGIYVNASAPSTTNGYDWHGKAILGDGNDVTAAATAGATSYAVYLHANKATVASGEFAGNYANGGEATITGGKYTATATGTTAYGIYLLAQTKQGDVLGRPKCTVTGGKFYGSANGGTDGAVNGDGQLGYFVLSGGYYNKNANLSKYKEEGKNVNDVLAGTPEYTEGYRYKISSELSGAAVCKVYTNANSPSLRAEYATLEEALQYVNANTGTNLTIVMIADYTLKKGDYILPSNATLIVPESLTRKSAMGTKPSREVVSPPVPVQFLMLTFDKGANMTVKGTIETSAVNTSANGGAAIAGAPHGNYGRLHLVEGSTMTLESNANLNCWGYITGKGEINALNGATVREGFQLGYWRGGTATSAMLNNKSTWHAFPVTDYFIQSVEAPILFRPGAKLLGYSSVNVSWPVGQQDANDVQLLGTNNSMFLMNPAEASEDTYVRKEYDPETDRAIWTVNSGAKLGSFSFSLAGNTVNSADYYLPVSNNMTIYVNEGEFTVTQDALLIPGAQIIISKLGKLTVASGKRLFVMDNEDWPGFVNHSNGAVSRWYYNALYSPSWTTNPRTLKYPPTTTRLPDAEIFVQGETEGSYYTSTSGANIHSTNDDAGKVKFVAAAGADNSIQHVVNTDNDRVTINFTTAQLKNETPETPYTSSKGTVAGEAFVYMEQQWVKVTDGCLTTRTDGSGTHEYAKPSDVVEVVSNGDNAYRDKATNSRYFINAEEALSNDQCVWWEVEPVTSGTYAGDYMANQEKYDNYGAYYYWDGTAGYWKPRYVTVTWKNQDGTTLATYTNVMCNTSPKYLSASPTWANTSIEKHDWVGWRDADGNIYDKNAVLPVAQGNITYTAYYNTSKYEYTITFKNPDNTVIWAGLVEAGTVPECPVAPTQAPTASTVYTFTGWNITLAEVTGTATYTAVYASSPRKYHVTFYNYDAQTVLYEADVDYNTRPVYAGVTPFRANTSSFSYEWTGWQKGSDTYDTDDDLAIVTGNVNYIATYSQTDLKYQVFFKRQDGSIIDAPLFNYEETPAAFPANPTLASTVSTDYTFDHWEPAELVSVTEEGKVYTAYFSESPRQYTAHFVNYDRKTLNADQTIDYNTVPTYTGAIPFKPNDSRNSFEFSGWAWEAGADWDAGSIDAGEAFPAVKGDITFTAQFTEIPLQFNVIYQREDGTIIEQQKKKWGETTDFPTTGLNYEDETYTYTFDHWNPAAVTNPVTADATYTVYFNQSIKTYSISNFGISPAGYGTVSPASVTGIPSGSAVTVNGNKITVNGTTVTATPTAADAQYTYEFDHWNNEPATVTANVTNIEAVFTRTTNTYTVTWKNGDTTLETDENVPYGTTPTYNSATPTKDQTAEYTYTFSSWDPAPEAVTAAATYTAQFNEAPRSYSVTLNTNEGTINSGNVTSYTYGVGATLPTNVSRTGYDFAGWFENNGFTGAAVTNISTTVIGAKEYWAKWTPKSYTITFNSNGGSAVSSITQDYGTSVTAPADPSREGYTFEGWNPAVPGTMPVNGVTCLAQWKINQYKLTVLSADEAMGTVTGGGKYDYNTPHTITATPKTGYKFVEWDDHNTNASREVTVTEDVTYTATFDYDIANYTVKHWQQNINNDEYTEVVTDRQTNLSGTIGTTTTAEAKEYTGFDAQPFSQQTIEVSGTVVNIYYNRKTYLIKWDVKLNGEQEAYKEETLRYGAMPSYGSTPTKEQSESEVYAFKGWTPEPYTVNKDQTYTGSFNVSPRPYTIAFINDNGDKLQSSSVNYGVVPSYGGITPVSSHADDDDGYTYKFAGWKPEIEEVAGEATYTAVYNRSADAIVVNTPETVVNNTIAPTTTVEDHGTLTIGDTENDVTLRTNVTVVENGGELVVTNGSSIGEKDPAEESIIIVESGGQLNVEDGGSVEADVFIIEATTEEQGTNPEALEEVQISGELSETGSKNVSAIYYDLTRKGGTEPFLARVWYAVAVPWAVEVPTYANGGVYIKRGDDYIEQRLGATFDLLSYDGACRATNGASANCWVYLEDEIVGGADAVMVPGKLYMIYLTEETSTIRFKKKAGEAIHTNSLTVSAHNETSNANDANWNGIANPATYRAYMNVNVGEGGLVQKFVPGTQPRDGGRYLPLDLTDKQAVGQPFFVQVDPTAGTSVVVTRNNTPTLAPRRAQAEGDKEVRYAIGIAANGKLADRLYIQTAEEKEDRYVIGQDISKMGISNYVAQMWVARYDVKLCLNTVAMARDKAVYPLGIYAPQAGEYMIFAPTDMEPGDNIYLTKDGRVIWNLTMAPYYATLEQGTTTNYGLRLIRSNAPAVTTGVDEVQSENAQCTKVIMDDHVYILRGEELYTITGQKAK